MPLTQHEQSFRYNMVKGRVAETLIQELFLSLGYNVFHYGMERSVPGIANLLKQNNTPVAREIRSMPDFIMQDPRMNEVYFVEVKYRANGEFSLTDLPSDYPWDNAYFIIVSRRHIKCITYAELKEGRKVGAGTRNFLGSRKEFALDKDTILAFCDMAVRFFEGV